MKTENIHIRISADLKEQIKKEADNQYQSVSDYIIQAILDKIKKGRN